MTETETTPYSVPPGSGTLDDNRDDERDDENEAPVRETDDRTEAPEEFEIEDDAEGEWTAVDRDGDEDDEGKV
jgi:hypothetical protein